ncbi:MAG: methyltransferase domain-containing protein [Planctomycetes bacterium]|nr:methyltransferase domain-containing protein [Planctomycetota bacterium]
MSRSHAILVLALLTTILLPGCAGTEEKSEGINAKFMDPDLDPEDWVKRWEVESREIYAARREIVAAIGLAPGDEIADVGAGTGLFTKPLSEAVGPHGRVLAIDIAPAFVKHLAERARREGLDNVEARLCSADSVDLPEGAVEFAFVCDTYHHFEEPTKTLASLYRALRPGGRLIVVDFERIEGVSRPWVLGHLRAGKEVFRAEIEKAGFRFLEEVTIAGFKENYFLRFERP